MSMEKFCDDLSVEVMTEMAENFFSRRVQLEQDLDHLHMLVTRLRGVGMETLRHWRGLYHLLLAGDGAREFFSSLGFDCQALLSYSMPWGESCPLRQPMALTLRRKYVKTALRAYEALHLAARDYNEGTYVPDPRDPRKKRRTPGLVQVKEACERVNREIKSVNEDQSPFCVLNFAKSMDPGRARQERIAGAIVDGDVTRIDKELAFLPVVFEDLGLPDIPTPPPAQEIEDRLAGLCRSLYDAHPEQAARYLREADHA